MGYKDMENKDMGNNVIDNNFDMDGGAAELYYRLALSAAANGNLSGAVRYARYACMFDPSHTNANKLLGICLYELGEFWESTEQPGRMWSDEVYAEYSEYADKLIEIYYLTRQQKWRSAARLAKSVPGQNVLLLNIQGCIQACAKHYDQAGRFFAKALEKDRGNQFALAGLTDVINRQE